VKDSSALSADRASALADSGAESIKALFHVSQRAQCLNFLLHLAPYTKSVLLVAGSHGSGKSVLLQQFVARREEIWEVASISATADLSKEAFVFRLAESLVFGARDEASVSSSIFSFCSEQLHEISRRGGHAIILIDDADQLSETLWQLLLPLIETTQQRGDQVSFVLFVDEPFLASTAHSALQKRDLHVFELLPLDFHETRDFVLQRLRATLHDTSTLADAEIQKLYKQSQGNLGRLCDSLDRMLDGRARAGVVAKSPVRKSVSPPAVELTGAVAAAQPEPTRAQHAMAPKTPLQWTIAVVGGGLLVLALVFQNSVNQYLVATPTAVPAEHVAKPKPIVVLPKAVTVRPPHFDIEDARAMESFSTDSIPVKTAVIWEPPLLAPQVNELSLQEDDPTAQNFLSRMGVTPPAPPQVAANKEIAKTASATKVPVAAARNAPTTTPAPKIAAVQKQNAAVATPTLAPPVTPGVAQREAWILSQASTQYTLQLIALSSEQALAKLIAPVKDPSMFAIFRFEHKKAGTMFGLVFGSYANPNDALRSAAHLPKGLGKLQPWVRRVGEVQDEIRRSAAPTMGAREPAGDIPPKSEATIVSPSVQAP